ncbi:MAG: hypothetical protein ACK4Y7_00640 [Caldimicrobium sp.]
MTAKKTKTINYLLYIFLFLGLFLISAEYILNLFGKTLCPEKGCEIVSLFALFSKNTFLLIGIAYFLLLLVFIFLYSKTQGSFFLNIIFFLLSGGLASEGIFFLRQYLDYERFCLFCILVASIIFAISFFFFLTLKGNTFKLSSIISQLLGALLGLIVSFYLTTEAKINLSNDRAYLIYAEDCPRCIELMSKRPSQEIEKIPFYKVYPLFRVLNLKSVPLLIEKSETATIITTSYEEIANKLLKRNSTINNNLCEPTNSTLGGLCEIP